jgi:hypothetical protein
VSLAASPNPLILLNPLTHKRGFIGNTVTRDAFAARVAVVLQARDLILFKSTSIAQGVDWTEAGRIGFVDEMFVEVLRDSHTDLDVRAVNFRIEEG